MSRASTGRSGAAALVLASALWLGALADAGGADPSCGAPGTRACPAEAQQGARVLLFGGRLDLNRAATASLETLPGIGPARAAAIVAERCRRPFERVEALERVSGIGPRIRAKLAPYVRATAETPARCPDPPA